MQIAIQQIFRAAKLVPRMALLFSLATAGASIGQTQSLPEFSFRGTDSAHVSRASLTADQPVFIYYFDPFCDHCLEQATEVKEHAELFNGTSSIWVMWGAMESAQEFYQEYLSEVPGTIVCIDDNYEFDELFGYSEVLSIYCYDAQWELVKRFIERESAEILLEAVQE